MYERQQWLKTGATHLTDLVIVLNDVVLICMGTSDLVGTY